MPLPAFLINVAVPVPLHQSFDYLPLDASNEKDYFPGQRVIVSFGRRELVGIVLKTHTPKTAPLHKLKSVTAILDSDTALHASIVELLQWSAQYYCHPIGEALHTALPHALRAPNREVALQKVIKWQRTDKPFEGRKNAHQQIKLLDTLASESDGLWQESLKALGFKPALLTKMAQAGYLLKIEVDPLSAALNSNKHLKAITLNQQQASAAEHLEHTLGQFKVSLLHGVTGSGKTEVYIKLVDKVVREGKQALVLIPEINLTPQTFSRFQSQLNHAIGIWHSDMSAKEKYTTWQLAKSGTANIIIGTRSAIFTPFKDLGLIIIDEEQDSSYKQIDNFKYSARDLAVKRGHIAHCPVILGSATPSLETFYNAQTGKYAWHRLDVRAGAGSKPEISLVDIKSRPLDNGISPPLSEKIKTEINAGNQVIIFQNRRGFSPTLMCYECGTVISCKHCDARMTVHSQPPHLHCHHCDYKRAYPNQCEHCQSTQLNPIGTGTERIELGLQNQFPDITILRIDRDAVKNQKQMEAQIEQINKGQPCIIVGTQMLAKGHDFHHVTLVAIIDADALFFSANFRAMEQGAQQLLQVAGRTGRGSKKGEVLIQTRQPEHPLFAAIIEQDYNAIASTELADRELCELPPYSKMISVRAESKYQDNTLQALSQLRHYLESSLENKAQVQIAGPIEAVMAKKSGIYRSYLHLFLLNNNLRKNVNAFICAFLQQQKNHYVRLSVDVDPQDYL